MFHSQQQNVLNSTKNIQKNLTSAPCRRVSSRKTPDHRLCSGSRT